ncbi:cytochrome C [Ensifer psoraleae]|uniref:Cytochrome C n=2 Tax=Sinorhizobium psoraleae TaxID=520838 RepID=A0ABT4KHE9_9HYPH|nr:cytochrome C [Sinorhizobium psoraleae]MCZ4091334.1 cytochrome C [Sinorhizobium psoraleae]
MQAASADLKAPLILAGIVIVLPLVMVAASVVKERQQRRSVAVAMTQGDPSLAPPIFRRYGCGGCHVIPGVPGADGKVGGPLVDLRERVYLGGVIENTADNLINWIVSPQRFSQRSAMPATGITEPEARHLAAYLYAQ